MLLSIFGFDDIWHLRQSSIRPLSRIQSCYQPVLSNKSSFLIKETTEAFDGVGTHN